VICLPTAVKNMGKLRFAAVGNGVHFYTVSIKTTATILFIHNFDVGRFPEIFHRCIQREMFNVAFVVFQTAPEIIMSLDLSNNRQTYCWEYHANEEMMLLAVFRLLAELERLHRRAFHCLIL